MDKCQRNIKAELRPIIIIDAHESNSGLHIEYNG